MVQAGVVREEGRMPKEPGRPDVVEVKQALPFALVSSQEESSGSGVGGQGGQEGEEERNSVHFTKWKQAGNGNSTRKKKRDLSHGENKFRRFQKKCFHFRRYLLISSLKDENLALFPHLLLAIFG